MPGIMEIPVASWHQAVFFRKSRRSFIPGRPVAEDQLERLRELTAKFRPFDGARLALVPESPQAVLTGLVGSYGRITGAPAFGVMIGALSVPDIAARVGYTGEGLILEATALGLGTCWVSGMFKEDEVRKRAHLEPEERIFAIAPLGVGERDFSWKEKIYKGALGSQKRKSPDDLTEGCVPLPWQESAVKAARVAPSARNRQPWSFVFEPDSITVLRDPGPDGERYPKSLDCGIAMLHLELGARAAGAPGRWTFLDPPAIARYRMIP